MIPRAIVDQVIETANANIVDVVGDYVTLKRRGASYMGCCPFHSEKTPSFAVTPAKGFCHCFGCHKGGNALNFIMEIEKLEFADAIRFLGRRFGIDVPEVILTPEKDAEQKGREALFGIMEYATRHFERNLTETQEGKALGLTYFRGRGFRDDTITTFRLGFSLSERDAFLKQATRDGYAEKLMVEAGLISVNEQGYKNDKFRGRVIFPIQNASGKVIAFGGRVLDARTKGVTLKYLNSPETALYVKSDIVYGIFQARTEISRQDKCFLVEGYTDVISMHQTGIANVVASSGTALTPNQIKLIKRFTKNITVLYDGDSAGIHASLRGINLILHEGMNARILLLPDGKDPDEFSRTHTVDEWMAYVNEHEQDFITFEAERLLADAGGDPIKKAETTHTIVESIAEVEDDIKREIYIKECSRIMQVSEDSLYKAVGERRTKVAIDLRNKEIAAERIKSLRESGKIAKPLGEEEPPPEFFASPEELGGTQPVQSVKPVQQNSKVREEVEFREVVRFFVTYTQNVLQAVEDGPITVGEYIIRELDADGFSSYEPMLNKIIDTYKEAEDRSQVNEMTFINLGDPDISAFIANVVGGRQELSRIHSKYTTVEREEDMLDTLVVRAVDELRLNRLLKMIEEATEQMNDLIKNGATEDEICAAMKQIADLTQVKCQMSKEMGERAVLI